MAERQKMSEIPKKILGIVIGAIFVSVAVVWILISGPKHIKDKNGEEDTSLAEISEEDILSQKMGARGGPNTSETHWETSTIGGSEGVEYFSRKFTGVAVLYTCTVTADSDISLGLSDFFVQSGNFAFYVVLDGEIVGEVTPNESGVAQFFLPSIEKNATLSYVIAGESASFSFTTPTAWDVT